MSAPASAAASVPRLRRLLCLHGFFQSASICRAKTAALRKVLAKTAELEYVQAPHEITSQSVFKNKPEGDIAENTYFASVDTKQKRVAICVSTCGRWARFAVRNCSH